MGARLPARLAGARQTASDLGRAAGAARPCGEQTLAIKPTESETFLREVDEELRREQLNNFVARYGWALIAAALLILAGVAGLIWYQGHRAQQRADQAEALVDALDKMEAGNRNAALPKLAAIADSHAPGYRAAALFARANAQIEQDQLPAAIATLRSIANDDGFAEPYRQAALVRQTTLEFDRLPPQVVVQRLTPLAQPGQAWFGTAGEMVAIAQLKLHRPDLAGRIFGQIARDENVPGSIRSRALQMAGSLGVNVTDALATPDATSQPQPQAPAAPPPATKGNSQ